MANIKSAKKRILTSQKSRLRNKTKKSDLRTAMKNLDVLIATATKEEALIQMNLVSKKLDSGITSGIVHKNYVARQKSNLMKKINVM